MKIHLKVQRLALAALATGAVGASATGTAHLLQTSASAQETAAATAPAKPAVTVDAAALALLKQMDAAYKGLDSYSGKMMRMVAAGKASSGMIQWAKPNKFKVSFGDDRSTTTAVSDGTTLFVSSSSDKTRYLKAAVPKDASALPIALSQSSASSLTLPVLLGSASIVDLFKFDKPDGTMSLAMGTEDTVDGTPVECVLVTQPIPTEVKSPFTNAIVYTFSLGKDDHLLRQIKATTRAEVGGMLLWSETYSDIKSSADMMGMDTATFTFTPPTGAKPVESLAPPEYDQRLKAGAMPITFTALDLGGKTLDLSQYKGKVVLLDFWATWCPPCRAELPNIVANYNKYHAQGFDVVGVSLDQSREALDKYIVEHKMPWRQVFDGKYWSSRVPVMYGVRSIPFALMLGRDGKITTLDVRGEALEPAIKAALAKK